MANKKKKTSRKSSKSKQRDYEPFYIEILFWSLLAVSSYIFVSNFGIGGVLGKWISYFFFGLFGLMQYIAPLLFFLAFSFLLANRKGKIKTIAIKKTVFAGILAVLLSEICAMVTDIDQSDLISMFEISAESKGGGGLIGGGLLYLMRTYIGLAGTIILIIL